MSARKRPAEVDSDDDEASNATSSPPESSSQVGSESRKRRRISDDTNTTPEHDQDGPSRMTGIDYSDDEHEEDSDDADADAEAEAQATQSLHDRRARDRNHGNVAREAGVLKNVEVFNFMCHSFFEFDVGPLINFVCGKNGSGKSAILTAIVLCLGGRVGSTNRAAKLANLIKQGSDSSRIICYIKNKGEDAYKAEEYGDVIAVERYFSRSGTSGYKIKSTSGRIVSTKKGELDAIVDHFNLQIENPLNVLSQDKARSFLQSSNQSEKYKFFVKGVQLEVLDQDYSILAEQQEQMKAKLKRKEGEIGELKQIAEQRLQEKLQAEKRDGMKDRMRDLRRQSAWCQVRNEEAILAGKDEELAEADRKIAAAQARVTELDASYQEADASCESTKTQYEEATQARVSVDQALEVVTAAMSEAKSAMSGAQNDVRESKTDQRRHDKAMSAAKTGIEAEEQRLLEANGGGAARRLEDLEGAKERLEKAKTDWNDHRASKAEIVQKMKDAERLVVEHYGEKERRQQTVQEQQRSIRDLQDNRDKQASGFLQNTEKLAQAIDRETRWSEKPLGPIGQYVKLIRPEWSAIIERVFGNTLSGFIVFSKQDSDMLNTLRRRVNCSADVFITNRHPLTPREPDEQLDTILRVLDIQNDLVKKQLIIGHTIEQCILVPDLDEATKIMYDSGRLHCVKACYSFNPRDKTKGFLLKYTANGGPAQDPVLAWKGRPRMKGDIEATIAIRQQALDTAQAEYKEAYDAWQKARMDGEKLKMALGRHNKREGELRIDVQSIEEEIETLQNAIEDDSVESGKLDEYRKALQDAKEAKETAEAAYKDAVLAQDQKKRTLQEKQRALEAVNERLKDAQGLEQQAREAHRQADVHRSFQLGEKHSQEARVKDAEKDRQSIEEQKRRTQESVNNLTEDATRGVGPRVNVPEDATLEGLMRQHEKLQADYNQWRRRLGFSVEEAATKAAEATKAYGQAKKDHDDLQRLRQANEDSLGDRRARWFEFRRRITARARINFSYLLSERGFRGELKVNHAKHLLDISVEPDITRRSATGRDAKTLSGGEKSFSQICLLLAMWEAMGSPIRCLDEFDVYMDAVNRSMSVKMIVEAARESIGRQYILISPGSRQDYPIARDVRVIDLGEPERGGQTTIEGTRGARR